MDVADLQFTQLHSKFEDSKRDQPNAAIRTRLEARRLLDESIDALCRYRDDRAPGWHASAADKRKVEKWIHDFGEEAVMTAMDDCGRQYIQFSQYGFATASSAWHGFNMIPRVCNVSQRKPDDKELYYARGIARNRLAEFDDRIALRLLKEAYNAGASIEKLQDFARIARNWVEFQQGLYLLAEIPSAEVAVERPQAVPSPELIGQLGLKSSAAIQQSVALVAVTKQLSSPEDVAQELLRQASASGEFVVTIDGDQQIFYFGSSRDGGGRTLAIREPWTERRIAEAIKDGFHLSLRSERS